MQHGVASLLLLSLIFFTQSSFTSGGKGDANGTKAPPVEGAVAANILKQSVPCEPWPYCVTSWVDSSLEERKRASSPLANILDAIKEGRERNCTQSAQCSPEERIEEIDSILKGVQQQWEEKGMPALAAISKLEDSLWKRWIEEAKKRVKDVVRLGRQRRKTEAVLVDVWLRRVSTLSLDSSLLPSCETAAQHPSTSASSSNVVDSLAGESRHASEQAARPQANWGREGSVREAALAASWMRSSVAAPPNISQPAVLATVRQKARCILRDMLDLMILEGDVMEATCPPNGKGDCIQRCRRFCSTNRECRVFATVGRSCIVSASLSNMDQIAPTLSRMPGAQVDWVAAPAATDHAVASIAPIKSKDTKLVKLFQQLKRQEPHSKGHKLGVIVPFRDGCSAMSQGKGRRDNLIEFVTHMPAFLDIVGVTDFRIIVVEQTQNGHWNKGVLFNRGVRYAESIGCDYLVMNDVDHIPVSDAISHAWPEVPIHLCTSTDMKGFQFYDAMVGGALLLRVEHYKQLNGFSNRYFGWGQEDDDMYERINYEFKGVRHLDEKLGRYHTLYPYPIPYTLYPRHCTLYPIP